MDKNIDTTALNCELGADELDGVSGGGAEADEVKRQLAQAYIDGLKLVPVLGTIVATEEVLVNAYRGLKKALK